MDDRNEAFRAFTFNKLKISVEFNGSCGDDVMQRHIVETIVVFDVNRKNIYH